jgi:drug/metabolite transporter (DMT)-like permease
MRDATDLGRPVAGVMWMLVTGLAFVAVSGIVKYVGTDIPAPQAAFLRFVFGVVFLAPALWALRGVRFPAPTWRLFWWRGAMHVAAVIFWFWAVVRVPVAEMTAIGFLGPVVMVVMAAVLMGETLERGRVVAVLAALVGALVVLRPGLREITPGHMAQIAATLCFAASYLRQAAERPGPRLGCRGDAVGDGGSLAVAACALGLGAGQLDAAGLACGGGGPWNAGALHDDAGVSGGPIDRHAAGCLCADPVGKR